MIGLIRAELKKFSSIRMTWVLIVSGVSLSLMYVMSYALMAGLDMGSGVMIPGLDDPSGLSVHLTYSGIGMGAYAIAIVLGIVSATAEQRYRTATATYLVTPHRSRVLAAKWIAAFLWGAIFAIIDLAVCLPAAGFLVSRVDGHFELATSDLATIAVGTLAAFALYAALGVAIGALVKNQIGAIVGALAWVMIVESILTTLVPEPARYLPGGAMAAMSEMVSLNGQGFLEPWQGGVLLLAYATVISLIAAKVGSRQDVS